MPGRATGPLIGVGQVIRPVPVPRWFADTVAVGAAAVMLIGENKDRTSVLIVNVGTTAVILGGPDVLTGESSQLNVGAGKSFSYIGSIWAACPGGTSTVTVDEESL